MLLSDLFFPKNDLAVAHQLVVQPQAVLVRGRFASGARRPAQQPHAGGRLKDIRRKWAPVHVKFHAQVAGVGDPGNLVAFIEYHDLGDESNKYGAFSHFRCGPGFARGPLLLILSVHSDDSIFPAKNSWTLVAAAANSLLGKLNSRSFTTNLYSRAS
jgi:hypothetical protein